MIYGVQAEIWLLTKRNMVFGFIVHLSRLWKVRLQSSSMVKRRSGKDLSTCSLWLSLWPRHTSFQDPSNTWRRLVVFANYRRTSSNLRLIRHIKHHSLVNELLYAKASIKVLSILCRICQTPFILEDEFLQTQCGTMLGSWKPRSPRFVCAKISL